MFSRQRFGAACAIAAALVAGCGAGGVQATPPAVARVDRTDVPRRLFDIRLKTVETAIAQGGAGAAHGGKAGVNKRLRLTILEGLIVDAVVSQEAADEGLTVRDSDVNVELQQEAKAAGGMDKLIEAQKTVGGGLDQLRDAIRSRLTETRVENRFAEARARDALAALTAGKSFDAVARDFSDDETSRAKGGDFGPVTEQQRATGDPGFGAAVASLPPGATTPAPVRDRFGYEILRVDAVEGTTRTVHRIVVAAPNPYTVKERPAWFTQSILQRIQELCTRNLIHVYLPGVPQPCTPESPGAAPSGAAPSTTGPSGVASP